MKSVKYILNNMSQLIFKLQQKLSPKQFQILAAIIVGIAAGAMAAVLKTLVHSIHRLTNAILTDNSETTDGLFSPEKMPFKVFLPIIGIVLTVWFVKKILRGDLGKGVSNILYEIAQKSAYVKRHKLFSHVITSALTVGMGGSAGLEAPIVITGSAVGSNIATAWNLPYRERVLFLGCGAAAGIAAVFNSPIAGVMFAMEVLLAEVTLSSFIPLIISAAVGALFSKIVFNEATLFQFRLQEAFNYKNVPYYLLLAVVSAFVSLYYVRVSHFISHFFKNWQINVYTKALIGGFILAGLIYIFPSLFGEGYASIRLLADGQTDVLLKNSIFSEHRFQDGWVIAFIGATIFVKAIATSVTLSSGGNGGNFAPSLFVGAFVGYCFALIFNKTFGLNLPLGNFSMVGMAGILSGVMYAPLTGIFLIAEVTGGYELIIPLMIVSTLSNFIVRNFEPVSLEVRDMIARGEVFSHDKDRNILLLLKTSNAIETDFKTIHVKATLRALIAVIKDSKRNLFAVINSDNELEGIITLDDVRNVMFETDKYDKIFIKTLMTAPPSVLSTHESMSDIMKKFDDTQAWNLPVVDENNHFIGFISKSNIFSKYRNELIEMSGEG